MLQVADELIKRGLDPFDIRRQDHEHLWERFFLEVCGFDFDESYSSRGKVITREVLEDHLDEILDYIEGFKQIVDNPILRPRPPGYGSWVADMDDIYIGYQVLGLLILYTKARLPFEVYDAILLSTTWDYDKTRMWAEFYGEKRKKNLEVFRNLIIMHKSNEE
ncbi:hypothetical protein ES705_31533 [subsurface metagenome]